MPRLVVPVATMKARVPEAPSTPDALPHPSTPRQGRHGCPRLVAAINGQDRADQLVGGQRQQAGVIGDLGECDEEDPEAHARDGAVDERSSRARRSIRRGLAGDQPDPRKGGEHTDPDQPTGTLTEGDARQHRQDRGPDRRDRRHEAHPAAGEPAEQEDAAGRRADSGQERPGEVRRGRAARQHQAGHEHDERAGGLPDQHDLP